MVYSQPILPDPVRFYGWGFLFYDIFMIMGTNKIISEELSRMKSLIGYQKGVVISEQIILKEQQTRQEVINSIYCGTDASGKLTAPGWQGKTFDEYSQGLTQPVTDAELATAKASCPTIKTAPQTSQQNQNYFGYQYSGGVNAPLGSFDNMTLVDCRNYTKVPLAPPGGALQNQFFKASALDFKIEENKKFYCDGEYMKSYLQKQNQPNTTTKKAPSTPPCSLPPELKDAEGVKSFQDWLDTNKAGWATGYKEGILKQGANGGGYGKFGPRTCKAWKYKNEYLNKSTEVKTGYEEYGGVSGDNKPADNVNQTQTGNAGQPPTGNAGQPPTGNAGQPPTGDVNQSNLEQMPMRDADYFNGYQ